MCIRIRVLDSSQRSSLLLRVALFLGLSGISKSLQGGELSDVQGRMGYGGFGGWSEGWGDRRL